MISFLKGIVDDITEEGIVLESGMTGYNIYLPSSSSFRIGENVKIYTYLSVREDALQLYGFRTKEERHMFKLIIGVNGIGPKGALGILSNIPAGDFQMAIMAEDSKLIAKAPGIGPKTAKKIILELKDKIGSTPLINTDSNIYVSDKADTDIFSEAVSALTALGYSATEAHKAVSAAASLLDDTADTEAYVKMALKQIISL